MRASILKLFIRKSLENSYIFRLSATPVCYARDHMSRLLTRKTRDPYSLDCRPAQSLNSLSFKSLWGTPNPFLTKKENKIFMGVDSKSQKHAFETLYMVDLSSLNWVCEDMLLPE